MPSEEALSTTTTTSGNARLRADRGERPGEEITPVTGDNHCTDISVFQLTPHAIAGLTRLST